MKAPLRRCASRIIFITGTDTGVGKTLLAGLLLHYLREAGCHALAMKPFCSGGTADVEFLSAIQDGELSAKELNPFYFAEPIAPLVAARKHRGKIQLSQVLEHIRRIAKRCDCLIVEGSGGLLVPLGEGFDVSTLIKKLDGEVVVAARNCLGVINHTLLTIGALRKLGCRRVKVVLMGSRFSDYSTQTNPLILNELLGGLPVASIGYLGAGIGQAKTLKNSCKNVKKTLAQILD